jgi:hypothetical protein
MKTKNPWPDNAIDEPREGYECVYSDFTGVKKYAPKQSEEGKKEPKKDK